jgi:hypothetical protein
MTRGLENEEESYVIILDHWEAQTNTQNATR